MLQSYRKENIYITATEFTLYKIQFLFS